MRIAVIGKGLIGGSFEKAAKRAGHEAAIFDKGEDFRVEDAEVRRFSTRARIFASRTRKSSLSPFRRRLSSRL